MSVHPSRPNILFVLTDQHRPDWVGDNPDVPVRTPTLDALADDGVRFTNAVCPSPVCAPSRASLASGMEYDRCGVPHGRDFPAERPTYYGRLRDDADYNVLGCGKLDLHKSSPTWDVDGTRHLDRLGFSGGVDCAGKGDAVGSGADEPADPYMAYLHDRDLAEAHVEDIRRRTRDGYYAATHPTSLPEDAYCDNWIARRALDELNALPEDEPWHLFVSFAGPHAPMDVTERMHGLYRDPDVTFPLPERPGDGVPDETHQEIRRNYAAMIENVDSWTGAFLSALEDRGELDDTIVVFAGDHGDMLGDYGAWMKRSPRQASVGVPLVVAGPGVERRGAVETPVSLVDLHATFLEYAGIDPPAHLDSRSLVPYLAGETDDHRDAVYAGLDPWRMIFDGRYKLVVGCDFERGPDAQVKSFHGTGDVADDPVDAHPTVLFDLERDEVTNRADDDPGLVADLRARLDAVRAGRDEP